MRINAISFTGLWEKGTAKQFSETIDDRRIPIIQQKIIYHPFSDETRKEIKTEMARYKETVLTLEDNRRKLPYSVIIHFYPIRGERLNFPSTEKKELPDMSFTPFGLYTK